MQLNFNDDIWYIAADNPTVEQNHRFDFSHFTSEQIKHQVKTYFWSQLQLGKVKRGSLARYCQGWRFFSTYLTETSLSLTYLDELSPTIVDSYKLYLNSTVRSSHTRTMIFAAFKSTIRYGQKLGLSGYPKHEIFSGSESRTFYHDDELKTKEIPQRILDQIDQAIEQERNVYIKAAIATARFTGIRLSEILTIEEGCIIKDFLDKPMLLTYSFKNDKDRAIPIPQMLTDIILELKSITSSLRKNGDRRLFLVQRKGTIKLLSQADARGLLKTFLKRHKIREDDGKLAQVTFHQFRHTVGMQAMNLGMNPKEIMDMLGHESFHSTSLYAKVRDEVLDREYRKIGFVGIMAKTIVDGVGAAFTPPKAIAGTLPDGVCSKAFEGESACGKFNKCLLCPKFITTPEYLEIHKDHLRRLQQDKAQYMMDSYICNIEKVERIEAALRTIIHQLEELR